MGLVTNGDFKTAGYSQFSGMGQTISPTPRVIRNMNGMNGTFDDIMATLFGDKGTTQVTDAAKTAATQSLLNILGNTVQNNPNAVKALNDALASTSKSTLQTIWDEYKWAIIVGGVLLTAGVGLGVYNTFKKPSKA